MKKSLFLLYGTVAYVLFLGTFLYAVGFVGNWIVPKSIDSAIGSDPATFTGTALAINLALMSLFAVQHSVMARPAFKRWWTTIVPQPIERSTFVLLTNACLALLFWQWRPMTEIVWDFGTTGAAFWALNLLCGLGWGIVLVSTFLLGHFDLFGMRQVVLAYQGKPYTYGQFRTPLFYSVVRHPLMLGFITAFWATPTMTLGHLIFAGVTTAYMLVAIQIEERDLVNHFGDTYRQYQGSVSMLIPRPTKKLPPTTTPTGKDRIGV